MAVWETLPPPTGGTVSALANHPDGSVLAGTLSGLFSAGNPISRWIRTTGQAEPRMVLSIGFHPVDPTTVFAGCSDGVYRSRDGGGSWKPMLASPPVTALAVAGDGVVLAATDGDGIFRSGNDGVHWEPANAGLLDLDVLSLAPTPGFSRSGVVYAGTASGLYRSVNGGRSWRGVDLLGASEIQVTAIAASFDFATDRTMFVGTDEDGLLRSVDGGATWAEVIEAERGSVTAMAARKGGIAAAFGERVCMSRGNRPFEASPPLPAPALALTFAGEHLIAGVAGLGIRVLHHGDWGEANEGLNAVQVTRLAHSGSMLVALAADGAIHSLTSRWKAEFGIHGSSVTDIAAGPGALWALAGDRLYASFDGAGTWRDMTVPDGLNPTAIAAAAPGKAIIGCSDGTIVLATKDTVFSLGKCGSGRVERVAAAGSSVVAATVANDTAIVWRAQAGNTTFTELMRFEGVTELLLAGSGDRNTAMAVAAHQSRIVIADLLVAEPELGLIDVSPATVRGLAARGAIFAATDAGLLESHDGGKNFALDRSPHAPVNLTALGFLGGDLCAADATGGLWIRRSA